MTRLAASGSFFFPTSAGGAVTPSSGLTVAVAAITGGQAVINGTTVATGYAGGTVTLDAASSTGNRRDIIYYDTSGSVGKVTGTPVTPVTYYVATSSGGAVTTALPSVVGPVPPSLSSSQIAIAEVYVAINETTIDAGEIVDRRQDPMSSVVVRRYKTATQVFTTDTAFADVADSTGEGFTFSAPASSVWIVEYHIPLTFGGTGGAKFQITGPAAPTGVDITGEFGAAIVNVGPTVTAALQGFVAVTAFATDIASRSSGITADIYSNQAAYPSSIFIRLRLINGATGGLVTLQAAQNNANSTTTLGIGSYMRAERVN